MIWGGISLNTKTQYVVVRGNQNTLRYQNEILTPVCIPHLQNTGRMRLMHDGAPSHAARATRALLQANRINVLPWPSLSLRTLLSAIFVQCTGVCLIFFCLFSIYSYSLYKRTTSDNEGEAPSNRFKPPPPPPVIHY